MKRTINRISLFGLLILTTSVGYAQIIDNYGLRVGVGLSNQYWDYKFEMYKNFSGWKEYKLGPMIYLNAEKKIIKYLSLRTELGYNQKGFTDEIYFVNSKLEGEVLLHNLSLNIGAKIIPFNTKLKPYLILGLRVDYLLSYEDIDAQYNGEPQGIYIGELADYNKFVLSGIIGIGLVYNELVYIDLEFNPAITKNLDKKGLSIKDKYFGFSIGLNINNIISKSK